MTRTALITVFVGNYIFKRHSFYVVCGMDTVLNRCTVYPLITVAERMHLRKSLTDEIAVANKAFSTTEVRKQNDVR